MNEEIDEALRTVCKTIEQWDTEVNNKNPTISTAKQLQFELSILKLIIGIEKFDELPAFSRYLREVTRLIEYKTNERNNNNNGDNK